MFEMIRKMTALLTPKERRQAVVLFGLMVVGAILEMMGVGAIPLFISLLADPAILHRVPAVEALADRLGLDTPQELILGGAIALFVLFFLKNLFLLGLSWVQARYVFGRQVHIARRLLRGYLFSPYTFHLRRNTAELLRNSNEDAFNLVGSGLMPLLTLAMEGLTVMGILLLLVFVEPVTSLTAFLILGATTALFLRLLRSRTLRYGKAMHEGRLKMIQAVNEGLGGIKVTKVLGREQAFLDTFVEAADTYAVSGRVRQLLSEGPRLLLETIGIASLLGVTALLLVQGRSLEALIPSLTLLGVAIVRMIPSFNRITGALNTLRYGRFALEAVHRDLSLLEVGATEASGEALPFREAIRFEGVSFQYPGAPEPTLRDVTLEIPRGVAVGFVGRTGAGKTTLVDLLLGLLSPTKGRLTVDGTDIHGRIRQWQRHVGYVPQDIYLSDDTIRRNIALGLKDEEVDEAAIWRAVDAAQAREFIERLPEGLETTVGERGVRLSGGQRQRIGIARALYHDPDVLVMDEATSSLDTETEQAVMEAVERLRNERTIVLIAHRLSTLRTCDYIVTVKEGKASVVRAPVADHPLLPH
jgi:ATP-binding cassette, subfamily B, bacterial PglK